ncbi:MAG: glycerophosphodiester phosphodiesterase [Chloroflexi bacterium]|nr:glycerophosphodiester phosphodiesterase [Chloroflexota bacterium]
MNDMQDAPGPSHPFARNGRPIIIGHRGAAGHLPENTMLSFQQAADWGVDGLELDIHLTADGVIVVCHDEFVERTTNGRGLIKEKTLAELQQLDAGYHFTPDNGQTFPFRGQQFTIPTLEDMFTAFPNHWINIDMKQKEPSLVRPFVNLIRQRHMEHNVMVGSFHRETVAEFRRALPEAASVGSLRETARLLAQSRLGLGRWFRSPAKAVQPSEYHGRWRIVTPQFIQAAHQSGTAVHVWTVNEPADMQRLVDWGVDGLISDYPDRALRQFGRL